MRQSPLASRCHPRCADRASASVAPAWPRVRQMTRSSVGGVDAGFLAELEPAARERLARLGSRKRFDTGAPLFLEGDLGPNVIIVHAGRVKVFATDTSGHSVLLAVRGPGDVLGDLGAIDGQSRSASGCRARTRRRPGDHGRRLPRVLGGRRPAPRSRSFASSSRVSAIPIVSGVEFGGTRHARSGRVAVGRTRRDIGRSHREGGIRITLALTPGRSRAMGRSVARSGCPRARVAPAPASHHHGPTRDRRHRSRRAPRGRPLEKGRVYRRRPNTSIHLIG